MFHRFSAWIRHHRRTLLTNEHVDPEQLEYLLSKFEGYTWSHFTPEGFARWLQPKSIRPLHIRAIGMDEPELFGAWLVTSDVPGDHFFYAAHLPRVHQVSVILHEVAHWAWGHSTLHLTVAQLETITAGGTLNLRSLPGVCRRAGETVSRADWEAEALALALFARYIRARIVQPVDSGLQRVLREEV